MGLLNRLRTPTTGPSPKTIYVLLQDHDPAAHIAGNTLKVRGGDRRQQPVHGDVLAADRQRARVRTVGEAMSCSPHVPRDDLGAANTTAIYPFDCE
jgi:hypothetical protein